MYRKLGALYAIITAALIATQPPLSSPAAKAMSSMKFVVLTEGGLLISVPLLLLATSDTRRDGIARLRSVSRTEGLASSWPAARPPSCSRA